MSVNKRLVNPLTDQLFEAVKLLKTSIARFVKASALKIQAACMPVVMTDIQQQDWRLLKF